jgi:hypothetical protein
MDREAILNRRAELLAEERNNECRWFWLSFADKAGFRGGCFVFAPGFMTAVERARALELNPGGEVVGVAVNEVPPPEWQNRLLTKADMEAGGGWVRIG